MASNLESSWSKPGGSLQLSPQHSTSWHQLFPTSKRLVDQLRQRTPFQESFNMWGLGLNIEANIRAMSVRCLKLLKSERNEEMSLNFQPRLNESSWVSDGIQDCQPQRLLSQKRKEGKVGSSMKVNPSNSASEVLPAFLQVRSGCVRPVSALVFPTQYFPRIRSSYGGLWLPHRRKPWNDNIAQPANSSACHESKAMHRWPLSAMPLDLDGWPRTAKQQPWNTTHQCCGNLAGLEEWKRCCGLLWPWHLRLAGDRGDMRLARAQVAWWSLGSKPQTLAGRHQSGWCMHMGANWSCTIQNMAGFRADKHRNHRTPLSKLVPGKSLLHLLRSWL